MKKILTFMLWAAFTATAQSQQPNPRLTQLEKFLQKKDFEVNQQQTNGQDGSIIHTTFACTTKQLQYMEEALDSIRTVFSHFGKEASESYMYEYHKQGIDTIKYSLAFQSENDTLKTSRGSNAVWRGNAREAAYVDYYRTPKEQGKTQEYCSFTHSYSIPTGIARKDMLCFDTVAFKALIQPGFDKIMKLKGVKKYPVHWQHDRDFDGGRDFQSTVSGVSKDGKRTWFEGLTTGTHYIIPSKYKIEAETLYQHLDSLTYDYVNKHPEQPYTYKYTTGYDIYDGDFINPYFYGYHYINDVVYKLYCVLDEDGNYHILSLNNKGQGWVPKQWKILKSYINGEKVYIKGMEPKEDKK